MGSFIANSFIVNNVAYGKKANRSISPLLNLTFSPILPVFPGKKMRLNMEYIAHIKTIVIKSHSQFSLPEGLVTPREQWR